MSQPQDQVDDQVARHAASHTPLDMRRGETAAARGTARASYEPHEPNEPYETEQLPVPSATHAAERSRHRPGRQPARGIRRTHYLPRDIAARLDQVVDDLAHELRMPKLDVLGALLGVALDRVDAVRDQLRRQRTPPDAVDP